MELCAKVPMCARQRATSQHPVSSDVLLLTFKSCHPLGNFTGGCCDVPVACAGVLATAPASCDGCDACGAAAGVCVGVSVVFGWVGGVGAGVAACRCSVTVFVYAAVYTRSASASDICTHTHIATHSPIPSRLLTCTCMIMRMAVYCTACVRNVTYLRCILCVVPL